MNICIIGDGLTSLSLAKNLINKKINVYYYHKNKIENSSSNRTIGISKNNLEFFRKEIHKFSKKIFWEIKKIEIYSEKLDEENLLKFENDEEDLFYMVKNEELYASLMSEISNNKYFKKIKIKNNLFLQNVQKKKIYDLIINCDSNNFLTKKYFTKKLEKNYFDVAYTAILKHEKIDNNTAVQIFTEFGPVAFLSLIHISEPTRRTPISYAVFWLKKSFFNDTATTEIYT